MAEEHLLQKTAAKISQGEIPSNEQLSQTILQTKEIIDESAKEAQLDTQGQKLVSDVKEVLDSAQHILVEKNPDEKLQSLVHHTQQLKEEIESQAKSAQSQVSSKLPSTSDLKKDALDLFNYSKDIAFLTIRSSEFRAFMVDLIQFFQQILSSSTKHLQKATDKITEGVISDVKEGTPLSSTKEEVKEVIGEVKEEIKEQTKSMWSEDQKDEYYRRFQSLIERINHSKEFRSALDKFLESF